MNSVVRKWGEQILRSRQYAASLALIIAFLSFFNLPVGWVSTVIIALVTLQNGPRQGLIIMAWAVLPAVALLYLGQSAVFINVFLLHYVIVWVFACLLRNTNSFESVLQFCAVLGAMCVVAIHFLAPNLQAGLISQLTVLAKQYKTANVLSNFNSADMDAVIKYIEIFAVGLITLAGILTNLMTLFIARCWQSTLVPLVNIRKEYLVIRVHYIAALLLIALLALFALGKETNLILNVVLVALIPFVFSGLSILHAYASLKKNGNIFLFIFYILFIVLSPYLIILASFLGWLDSFFNFRKKLVISDVVAEEEQR